MASPAKKSKTGGMISILGYIHGVSPFKTSSKTNVRYFEATLQTEKEEFHRLVSFVSNKPETFLQMSTRRQCLELVQAFVSNKRETFLQMSTRTQCLELVEVKRAPCKSRIRFP